MKMSESISSLATALSVAQGQMDDASKDAKNEHFRSKYADMAAVRAVIREPLSKNDLSVIQLPRMTAEGVEVETMLIHKTGEFISETLQMPLMKRDAHGVGSAITYARRYGLMSILCLASDDDDGNAAVSLAATARAPAPAPAAEKIKAHTQTDIMRAAILIEEGRRIAEKGTDKLSSWYRGLSDTDRNLIPAKEIPNLKSIAAAADKGGDDEAGN